MKSKAGRTNPRYDALMASEVCFAVLAADDFVRVEVDIVLEAHLPGPPSSGDAGGRGLKDEEILRHFPAQPLLM